MIKNAYNKKKEKERKLWDIYQRLNFDMQKQNRLGLLIIVTLQFFINIIM